MKADIYGGRDPVSLPAYTLGEAAKVLHIPHVTLRTWFLPRSDRQGRGPLLRLADGDLRLLSFVNLVEAHVLRALRKEHEVSMYAVRMAVKELPRHSPEQHPLAYEDLLTDANQIFLRKYGQLINLNRAGQLRIREWLEGHLKRLRWGAAGRPVALFPLLPQQELQSPATIECNPRVLFGQPVLAGTRVPTAEIAARYEAGEDPSTIADDLHQSQDKILDAIRFEAAA